MIEMLLNLLWLIIYDSVSLHKSSYKRYGVILAKLCICFQKAMKASALLSTVFKKEEEI